MLFISYPQNKNNFSFRWSPPFEAYAFPHGHLNKRKVIWFLFKFEIFSDNDHLADFVGAQKLVRTQNGEERFLCSGVHAAERPDVWVTVMRYWSDALLEGYDRADQGTVTHRWGN